MENNETEVINIGASAYRLYNWMKDIWTKKDGMEYKRQKDRQIKKDVFESLKSIWMDQKYSKDMKRARNNGWKEQ